MALNLYRLRDRMLAADIRCEAKVTSQTARGYSMKAAGKNGEICLYDDIGESFWGGGISAAQFKKDLDALGAVNTIDLRINSPGGQVFDGLTIYNLLAQHKARITTHIDGLAASIASVIAMAGDEIRMADCAMMMIHNAAGMCAGTAEEMRSTADLLDTVTGTLQGVYAKRSGLDAGKIGKMMDDETWMTAQQAVDCGLANKIVDSMNVSAMADLSRYKFRNAPTALLARVEPSERPNRKRFEARFQALRAVSLREQTARRT
jgi:ATP-dependent Clp endopeptidase proteolytic subunit ClpP